MDQLTPQKIKVADICFCEIVTSLVFFLFIFPSVTFQTEFTFSFNCTLYFYIKSRISDVTTSLSSVEQLLSSHRTCIYVPTAEIELQHNYNSELARKIKCILRFYFFTGCTQETEVLIQKNPSKPHFLLLLLLFKLRQWIYLSN